MTPLAERLRAHWIAQGIEPPPGVDEERLLAFEKQHGLEWPPDLRAYFRHIDGMGNRSVLDDDFFGFWPLRDLQSVREAYPALSLDDAESWFVFADHSIMLPAFAIRLNTAGSQGHPVIAIIGDLPPHDVRIVAESFTDFAQRYLSSDDSRFDLI